MTEQSTPTSDTDDARTVRQSRLSESQEKVRESFVEGFRRGVANALTLASGKVPAVTHHGTGPVVIEQFLAEVPGEHLVFETSLVGVEEGRLVVLVPAAEARSVLSLVGVEEVDMDRGVPAELVEAVNGAFTEACRMLSTDHSISISCGLVDARVESLDRSWFGRNFPDCETAIRSHYEISGPEEVHVNLHLLFAGERRPAENREPQHAARKASTEVRPAAFQELTASFSDAEPRNLDLLLDVNLCVRVELGRTALRVQEVLELGPGSVVELDKLAGEPVDLLVNEQLFARGEVVVIDENFGVRVTDIVSPMERIEAMRQAKS